jgi:hypothetical protein
VLAPLYAALTAAGALRVGRWAAPELDRREGRRAEATVALTVLAIVLATCTVPGAVKLWGVTEVAFAEEAAAAAALREAALPGEPVFCEDGKIEVLSELAPERFTRLRIADVTPRHVTWLATRAGSVLVVAARDRALHLPGGRVVWSGGALAILRYDAAAGEGAP